MKISKSDKVLIVYIEPTPYILDLIEALEMQWPGKIHVIFVHTNKSQSWDLKLQKNYLLMPKNIFKKISLIIKMTLRNKYKIMHVAGWSDISCMLCFIVAKILGIPIVVESDTHYHHSTWIKTGLKKTLYPLIFSHIDYFMPGGKRQQKYLVNYKVKPSKMTIAQMTVNIEKIKGFREQFSKTDKLYFRSQYAIKENYTVYIFVGRLVGEKGLLDLLSIFKSKELSSCYLVIIGQGPLRNDVINFPSENIIFLDRLSDKALWLAFYAADVLVLPAYFEPWGLVVNEAMAMKLPVIVSDQVGCLEDIVQHNITGLIVPAGNKDKLLESILQLANDPSLRHAMGENASQLISGWTLKNEGKNICQAWNGLMI